MIGTPGLTDLVGKLGGDVREMAQAEIALLRARAGIRVARYRTAAIFFAVAGTLALAALIALLVGLIMTLAPRIGPGVATMVVIGISFLVAGILAFLGRSALRPSGDAR